MKRYSCFWIAALLLATSCVDHRYDYMVDDSAYFAKSDLQEETLSVMNAQDYVYEVWIHKSGYWQEKFAARLELDYNYLVQYNSTNGTDFEMLDEKYYTFERDFIIEEGKNETCIPLTIKVEQVITDIGYGTFYIPLSVNSLTPGKEVYVEKSHFILALTLQQPVLKIDGIGFEDSNGVYNGNVYVDANAYSGDSYELDITAMLDVQTTEELEVIYRDGVLAENERKLDSQYYNYSKSVIMPVDKQYAENYLTVNIKDMPDGKWVIPVEITTSNDKIQVNQEKSWVKLTVIKGSIDEDIQCTGDYAQGNEIIISAGQTLTDAVIANIGERNMTVSCIDNSTSEIPNWMSVSIINSDVKLSVTGTNTSIYKEQVATITLTDNDNLLEKVITVRRCMDGYGTILNKNLWELIGYSGSNTSDNASHFYKLYNNFWPSNSAEAAEGKPNSSYIEVKPGTNDAPVSFTFDLGENPNDYNAFGIMPRLQWGGNSPKYVKIEVSEDGSVWEDVTGGYQTAFTSSSGISYTNPGTKWFKLSDSGTINKRYLRFSMTESIGGTLCIDEVFVANRSFD